MCQCRTLRTASESILSDVHQSLKYAFEMICSEVRTDRPALMCQNFYKYVCSSRDLKKMLGASLLRLLHLLQLESSMPSTSATADTSAASVHLSKKNMSVVGCGAARTRGDVRGMSNTSIATEPLCKSVHLERHCDKLLNKTSPFMLLILLLLPMFVYQVQRHQAKHA